MLLPACNPSHQPACITFLRHFNLSRIPRLDATCKLSLHETGDSLFFVHLFFVICIVQVDASGCKEHICQLFVLFIFLPFYPPRLTIESYNLAIHGLRPFIPDSCFNFLLV